MGLGGTVSSNYSSQHDPDLAHCLPSSNRRLGSDQAVQSAKHTPVAWRRSSACESGACVEVATSDGHVLIRDSRGGTPPMLRFPSGEWIAFVTAVKSLDGTSFS